MPEEILTDFFRLNWPNRLSAVQLIFNQDKFRQIFVPPFLTPHSSFYFAPYSTPSRSSELVSSTATVSL